MQAFIFMLLLGAVSLVSGAAFHPIRQANQTTAAATGCGVPKTFTTTVTVGLPTFITVVNPNSSSIASSLSRAASIDTVQISDSSELRPVSATVTPTALPTFVHSIVVPGFTASEVNNGNSSIYFVSIGPNTTDWSYTPTQLVTIGVTTVTVAPIQSTHSAAPSTSANLTLITRTSRATVTVTGNTAYTPYSSGWNVTHLNGSTIAGATGNTPYTPYASGWNTTQSTNSTIASASGTGANGPSIVTVTETTTVKTTVESTDWFSPTYTGFGYPALTAPPSTTATEHSFGRRQAPTSVPDASGVCTLIYAVISGHLASWCNNWDGSSAVLVATYTTTITPFPPPGSTSPAASPPSRSTTTTVITVSTTTVANTIPPDSSTSSAPPAATSCGQTGNFEINFDGLPTFSPPNNDTAPFPPIWNPYEHFFWGNGWAYVPPPNEPYPPQSGNRLAEYVPSNAGNDTGSPDTDQVPDSSFGCGPRAYDNNFWFNAQSAFVGCDNGATGPTITCDFVATGYQWDFPSQKEKVVVTQHFIQPPCPNFQNCALQQIIFNSEFTQLTSLSFYANVQGQLKIYWVDTIELSWWNQTCAAGLNRIRQE